MTYKTPTVLVNMWQRVGLFLFSTTIFFLIFTMDDMLRMFVPFKLGYPGVASDPVIPNRY